MRILSYIKENHLPLRIAYLINIYPMPSQSFIRRELAGLEALGVSVLRYTLRRWDGVLIDPLDLDELSENPCGSRSRDDGPALGFAQDGTRFDRVDFSAPLVSLYGSANVPGVRGREYSAISSTLPKRVSCCHGIASRAWSMFTHTSAVTRR